MARSMAGCREEPDSWSHFGVILNEFPVLPGRKNVGDALASGPAAFRQFLDPTRLRPPLVFHAVDDQLGIGEDGGVGAFFHQSPNMIGMEVRDQDRADLAAVDTGGVHVGG